MKKILYLHAGAEMYGADKILLEIVENLDKSKYTPIVILPENGVLVDELEKAKVDVCVLSYPIVRRKYFTPVGILKFVFQYLWFSVKLASIVHKNHIDIVHVNTTAVWEGVWLKLFTKAMIVWHVHEIIMHPRMVYKVVAFLLQHFADKIITVSDAAAEHLTKDGFVSATKVSTIHNGILGNQVVGIKDDVFADQLELKPNNLVIGMIGRINSWKGQPDFVKAVNIVLKEAPDAVAVIVGSPYEGEENRLVELQMIISKLEPDVKERIKVVPFQSNVAKVYNLFDVFVMPSTSPDPFPTVVLEAMANGLPVVGYRHGGVQEMVEENKSGILVSPLDSEAMANAIFELVKDPQKRIQFGNNARTRQQSEFEAEAFVNKIQALYV